MSSVIITIIVVILSVLVALLHFILSLRDYKCTSRLALRLNPAVLKLILHYSLATARETQPRSFSLEVPSTSLTTMESLHWMSVCRWVFHFWVFFSLPILSSFGLCYSALSFFCRPQGGYGETCEILIQHHSRLFLTLIQMTQNNDIKENMVSEFVSDVTQKSILYFRLVTSVCVCVAQTGSGTCLSAEW